MVSTLWFFFFAADQHAGAVIVGAGGVRVGGSADIETNRLQRPAGGPLPGAPAGVFQRPSPFPSVRPARFSPTWHALHPRQVHTQVAVGGLEISGAAAIETGRFVRGLGGVVVGGVASIETFVNEDEEFLLWLEAA
jgi:hypothetical protein